MVSCDIMSFRYAVEFQTTSSTMVKYFYDHTHTRTHIRPERYTILPMASLHWCTDGRNMPRNSSTMPAKTGKKNKRIFPPPSGACRLLCMLSRQVFDVSQQRLNPGCSVTYTQSWFSLSASDVDSQPEAEGSAGAVDVCTWSMEASKSFSFSMIVFIVSYSDVTLFGCSEDICTSFQ